MLKTKSKTSEIKATIPTVLLIFGATGDLMAKKIVPALFHLYSKNKLPTYFKVVGFSRRNLSDKTFQSHVLKILQKHGDSKAGKREINEFTNYFSYTQGLFQHKRAYQKLAKQLDYIDQEWNVCSNKLFYLAVPPQFYEVIFKNLALSGLTKPCSDEKGWTPLEDERHSILRKRYSNNNLGEFKQPLNPLTGWTRVLVEKPFGKDLQTAKRLDAMLSSLFREEQIYRIDHYLAKEMLQNILAFRFCNTILEHEWSNDFIEKIEIRLLESIGVEDRGSFYDGLGALRDVGQNHMLQMLALITMDQPSTLDTRSVRKKREDILTFLPRLAAKQIQKSSFRAQYKGYKTIKGVARGSSTETYFKLKGFLNSDRWHGVPFILESGKRLGKTQKQILVTFKHHAPCLCPPDTDKHFKNKVIFSLAPQEGISIYFYSKKPGLQFDFERRTFNFAYRKKSKKTPYSEEYEKLLFDTIIGDQTLFVSTREVEHMWRFIDPIIKAWQNNTVPLKIYEPDTRDILKRSPFIEGAWLVTPQLKKEIGIIGLGKMGSNIAQRLIEKRWKVYGYSKTPTTTQKLEQYGLTGAYSLKELVKRLKPPRIIWVMIPAGKPVDEVVFGKGGLATLLDTGDSIIDGGNSFYKDSVARHKKLAKKGIIFIDVGVSGGPSGAKNGACLMVGGDKKTYNKLLPLCIDLSVKNGAAHFPGAGAGHFVKMVHNGIEYGMMQAIAEGFTILQASQYTLDLKSVADVYNHGSVIESRLMGWLKKAFELHNQNLKSVSGRVGHTGEGAWTAQTAKEMKVKAKIIKGALDFRIQSEKNPTYTGKILSALREQFGGHDINEKLKAKK